MKTFYKIMSLLLVTAIAVVSCDKKELEYEVAAPDSDSCYSVYFPVQDASGDHTYDPDMDRTVTIKVARPAEKSNGAITVPYVIKASEEGIFEGGEIVFEDGQTETEVEVAFPNAEEGTKYSFELSVTDPNYASVYGSNPTSLTFSVLIVTWEYILNPKTGEPSLFTITQNAWSEVCFAYIKYYEVNDVRTCIAELTGKHIYNGEEYESPYFWGPEGAEVQLEFKMYPKALNADGNMFVELPPLAYYYHPSYESMIYMYDWYYYWTVYNPQASLAGVSFVDFAKAYNDTYPLGYYDNNGGLFFFIKGRYMTGIGGWGMETYDIVGIGEGFTRVDYSLSLESDFSSKGETPIYVEAGADVASLKYAFYEGELTAKEAAAAAAAIIAGTDPSESFSEFEFDEEEAINYATLSVAPETTGLYTLVAVGYNEAEEAQESAFVAFKHIAKDDTEKYAVEIFVGTEPVPARYGEQYNEYNSFAFYVKGTDIEEAHIAIVETSNVTEEFITDVKTNIEYAVSESVLSDINAAGGFYTAINGLSANTSYTLLVWATNGDMDAFAYADYTTEKLPYVWNSLGKGTLTDGFFMSLFSRPDYTVECDVYEEASTPGLYMITGYQCALAASFFSVTPETMAPYENANWKNTELLVDATNPAAVVISNQEYGVLVNSNYGWIKIDTDPTGTLENGEITFPVKNMYVYLGGWYYGNTAGTFKITLPAANPTAPIAAPANAKGSVQSVSLGKNAQKANRTQIFERDPKPVQMDVKVSYQRKEKEARNLYAKVSE